MLFPSSVTTSRRKSLQRPESWFPLSPGLPAVTQVPAGANRGRQKPKLSECGRQEGGGVGFRRSVVSAERRGQGFLPGPAAPQQPPCLLGPSGRSHSRLCPAHRPGPAAPLLGPQDWSAVSSGVTSMDTNLLWSRCRGRGPGSQGPSVGRVWQRFPEGLECDRLPGKGEKRGL